MLQTPEESKIKRWIDATLTEAFNLFAAGAYFGLWEGMEVYLNTYYLESEELGVSALETVVKCCLILHTVSKFTIKFSNYFHHDTFFLLQS